MADMDEFRDMFFVECDELLEVLATGLRQIEQPGFDVETVHAVFRAVHSVKGGAAAFGLTTLVTFAHRFETVLDLVRSDRLDVTPQIMALLHRCSDCLTDLVASARSGRDTDQAQVDGLMTELAALIDTETPEETAFEFTPISLDFDMPLSFDPVPPPASGLLVQMTPTFQLYRSGNDPMALLNALRKLGDADVHLDCEAVAQLEDWSPEQPALSWRVRLTGAASQPDVMSVFEYVEDCCALSVRPLTDDDLPAPTPEPAAAPADTAPVAQIVRDAPTTAPPRAVQQQDSAQAAPTIRVALDLSLIHI